MVIAYIVAIGFSLFFYFHDVHVIFYNGIFCFFLFLSYGIASYFTDNLVWLFRLSVLTAFYAFFFQAFFTGGVLSPALMEFIIPPVVAFFYRPVRDKIYFMSMAVVLASCMWLLSYLGYTKDYFPPECAMEMNVISSFFVYGMIGLYFYLYRRSLSAKNKELKKSYQELQATSQKLIEAEKMASLGVLSAGVAHEINNPLNFIKGGIEMLAIQLQDSKEAQPFVKAVDEGVKRASSIVNSLAHFSRDTPSKEEVCDIHEIIDNCLVMLNHKLKYRVEVIRDYGDLGSWRIIGNEGQLHQAILNIISNAEQAIAEEGTITIRTRLENSQLYLTIADTGCGIDPAHLPRIRDPFFTTKTSGEGTGLGLSITYKVIEEHQGSIVVESQLAEGTLFHIIFNHLQMPAGE